MTVVLPAYIKQELHFKFLPMQINELKNTYTEVNICISNYTVLHLIRLTCIDITDEGDRDAEDDDKQVG